MCGELVDFDPGQLLGLKRFDELFDGDFVNDSGD